jgi:hypothetical protein
MVARLPGLLDKHQLPGMAIGICDADSVLWSAGFGHTRAAGGVPITTETMSARSLHRVQR